LDARSLARHVYEQVVPIDVLVPPRETLRDLLLLHCPTTAATTSRRWDRFGHANLRIAILQVDIDLFPRGRVPPSFGNSSLERAFLHLSTSALGVRDGGNPARRRDGNVHDAVIHLRLDFARLDGVPEASNAVPDRLGLDLPLTALPRRSDEPRGLCLAALCHIDVGTTGRIQIDRDLASGEAWIAFQNLLRNLLPTELSLCLSPFGGELDASIIRDPDLVGIVQERRLLNDLLLGFSSTLTKIVFALLQTLV
jgi:hypothetical protein